MDNKNYFINDLVRNIHTLYILAKLKNLNFIKELFSFSNSNATQEEYNSTHETEKKVLVLLITVMSMY